MRRHTVTTLLFLTVASVTLSNAALLAPEPTAAPRLQKRVFPTGSAAVASFLATIDPAELSTYFSWAAHGNNGFISHAQSFTSANAAQYSSYLAAKNIGSSEASAILGGIQTESTEAAGTGAGSEAGAGSGSSTGAASDSITVASSSSGGTGSGASGSGSSASTATPSDLTTLANGVVLQTLPDGQYVQGISLSNAGSLIPVSTAGAGGSLVPASTTYPVGYALPTSTATAASPSMSGAPAASSSSSAPATTSSGSSDASLPTLSVNLASLFATTLAVLVAACLYL